jgi:hypothetical protein
MLYRKGLSSSALAAPGLEGDTKVAEKVTAAEVTPVSRENMPI